jgi:hypothetical protein
LGFAWRSRASRDFSIRMSNSQPRRHCEERSDEAIQSVSADAVWIASLPPTR